MRNCKPTLAAALALAASITVSAAQTPATAQTPAGGGSGIAVVAVPSSGSPLVAIRLLFYAGSIYDPAGKEGLAALTAQMIGQSGTAKRSYSELVQALYPMAATIDSNTDREVTVFTGEVHRDKLADYTALLEEALLQPGFAQSDFERNKEQLLAYLTTTLRSSDDELLGLEAIQDEIFARHPYGHPAAGTVAGLKSITLEDVKSFYRQHYTQAGLILGVAGGYPAGYVEQLGKNLAVLPAGQSGRKELPPAPKTAGRNFHLIEKETGSVGVHLGYALPVNRTDADYYPLMVANSYLGEHRTFHGRLQQQLRQARGLNYGDYSYVEFLQSPPRTSKPTPNVPRREQFFSVWLRPLVPSTAQFAVRDALYEVERLRDKGMTQADFDLTREFLLNYSKLWGQTLQTRLGFQMDSRYYGMPSYLDEIQARLPKLTLDDVNRAARKYFQTESYEAVIVTAKAAELKAALEKDGPSPMKYNSQAAPDIAEADKTIEVLKIKPTAIEIVPVSQMFEK
ncbi:MAG TPA: pitrilysin family protein [Thermoanaerobaculia bacterium]|jgi:zinc protease|nr:pitrilysin family protein [Thermoanaerobaculia bacterium]